MFVDPLDALALHLVGHRGGVHGGGEEAKQYRLRAGKQAKMFEQLPIGPVVVANGVLDDIVPQGAVLTTVVPDRRHRGERPDLFEKLELVLFLTERFAVEEQIGKASVRESRGQYR